jgi:hypothetical protein
MKQFSIRFQFEGRSYDADVTEIGGLEDIQYAISPKDEKLAERFKTNVIRKLKDGTGYQYSFPESSAGIGKAFMESLAKGLNDYLTGSE